MKKNFDFSKKLSHKNAIKGQNKVNFGVADFADFQKAKCRFSTKKIWQHCLLSTCLRVTVCRLIFSGCNLEFEIVDDGNFIALLRKNILTYLKVIRLPEKTERI